KTFLIDSGIDDFPAVDLPTIELAMPVIARSAIPLLAHAELEGRPVPMADADWTRYETYLRSRPDAWETEAISLLAKLASRHACRTHIVHLATAAALPMINEARRSGVRITVEVCPHHLYFDAGSVGRGQTLFKCAPPIRDRANRERLVEALIDGQIDFIASDHSPTTPSRKALGSGDFKKAWGGIASVQLRLPVIWTLLRTRGASLTVLSRWLSERPAEFLGIAGRKGQIEVGRDADFVIWDPEASFTVTREGLHDRHRLTPYENEVLFGCVIATYLRGRPVFQDGSFGEPMGSLLSRTEPNHARTKMQRG
ncbi:MAG: amidohydrolase family protein, partial [Rhodothermales bacterium]